MMDDMTFVIPKRTAWTIAIILFVGLCVGFVFGYLAHKKDCHVDDADVEHIKWLVDNGTDFWVKIDRQTTVEGVFGAYQYYYPYSKAVLELELTNLCN